MPLRRKVFAASLLVLLPLLAGCGALFGQRYTNFTAFYNTFYNARQAFEREEREILRADEVIDRTVFLSAFIEPTSARQSQNLENAIRRGADVLRHHPDSRWVDDALLLIGKSYHYQGNYDAAAQKFREVLALEVPRLADESYLWLGRSLMGAMDHAGAVSALREGLGRESIHHRWASQMHLALGESLVRQDDLDEAIVELRAGLEGVDERLLAARGSFLLGQALEAIGAHEEAADAFGASLQSRPMPELEYAAELQRAIALSHAERHDAALARLDRLRRDDRYFQQRGEIELTRARALAAAGRADEAQRLMTRLLYGDNPNIRVDQIRGQAHYYLGAVYRDHLQNYRRAAVHFDTAATALRSPTVAGREIRRTREAILDVERVAEDYGSYARVREQLVEMDSLLYLGSLDEDAFTLAIEEIAAERHEELLRQEEDRRRMQEQQGFGGMGGMAGAGLDGVTGPTGEGEGGGAASFGFLNYQNPVRVQESLIAFQARWGDRPHTTNWRRAAAVSLAGGPDDDLDEEFALGDAAASPEVMMAALVDVSDVPRTEDAQFLMRAERATARYELGNVLFLTLGQPEVAENWYQMVLDEDPESHVAPRARYALAEVYAAMENDDRASELFEDIAEWEQQPELSAAARQRIGLPAIELPPDSARLAENAYAEAYDAWQRDDHEHAMLGMLDVDLRFRPSDVAARARLAAALIYSDWANGDTLILLAESPAPLVPADAWQPPVFEEDMVEGDEGWIEGDEGWIEGDEGWIESDEGWIESDEGWIEEDGELLDEAFDPLGEPDGDGDVEGPEAVPEAPGQDVTPASQTEEPVLPTPSDGETPAPAPQNDELPLAEPPIQDSPAPEPFNDDSVPPDSLAVGDALDGQHDPTQAAEGPLPPDSLALESALIALDTLGTPLFDLPEPPEPAEPWLLIVYDTIIEEYAQTPYAQRAQALRTAIAETREDYLISIGLLEVEPEDGFEPEEGSEPEEEPPPGDPFAGLMGLDAIDPSAGGFSWVVFVADGERAARNQLLAFQNSGYRAALLPDAGPEGGEFFVLLGQFATEEDADLAAAELPPGADEAVLDMIPLDASLILLSAMDLLDAAEE